MMNRHAGWRRSIAAALVATGMTVSLAACGGSRVPTADTAALVTAAPVQVADTALGTVGYREVGSGAPLVLIMGYAGTMETWAPQFVDTLALHNRVVIFDNAGIGDTKALPAPLTIDAMANQTSALIEALGLGRTNVLGWSMGGMIAQALAVLHPAQVRRLVLCATFPGVGTVVPPQSAINNLTNGSGQDELFPADQAMAAAAFAGGTAGYPAAAAASAAVISAQGQAALGWFHGADAAGRATSRITAPALVADGTADKLDAVSNSKTIARLIPGAELRLYPDAGHGFLFQEGTPFAFTVASFLAGAPASLGTAAVRAAVLSGQAQVSVVGKTWAAQLKALTAASSAPPVPGMATPAGPTAAEVAGIDQPFAGTLGDLDYRLLSAGASGGLGSVVSTFVTADERLVNDVLALAGLSGPAAKTWQVTITKDGNAEQQADAALRNALGLPPVTDRAATG
jgi:pimeloyl-ACP methyl ester carboxylesterase